MDQEEPVRRIHELFMGREAAIGILFRGTAGSPFHRCTADLVSWKAREGAVVGYSVFAI
jgi:hypothetical protein